MRQIVLQERRKRMGCPWKDFMRYSAQINEITALDSARWELIKRKPGGAHADIDYNNKREWRVIFRETIEYVVE